MPDLIPTSADRQSLGHLARVLERRFPGILDEWVESLQNEALLNEIVKLRGPREAEYVKAARTEALGWAQHVRLVTLAMLARLSPPEPVTPRRPARRKLGGPEQHQD